MIFIVDDDPIQNLLIGQLLKSVKDDVVYKEFANGAEVIEALKEGFVPQIILLDINMPIMSGWEFLDAYKEYKEKADVFIVSSSSNEQDVAKSDQFQCVKGYFNKPVNTDSIQKMLGMSGSS